VKQEGGSVNAWCVPMSQIRNRETLMAVRPRDEGRVSYLKDSQGISGWTGPGTQRQIWALKVGSGAQAWMANEIHIDPKIYNPVFWLDGFDVA
jgi:hypothetical protein